MSRQPSYDTAPDRAAGDDTAPGRTTAGRTTPGHTTAGHATAGHTTPAAAAPERTGQDPRPPWVVVDAAVLAVALTDDGPDGDRVRERLTGCRLVAPSIVDLEVLSVWHRGAASGAVPQRRIDLAMADLARIPLTRVDPIDVLPACWERLEAFAVPEAAYLALAEALQAPLLTAEPRLARAGSPVRVELLR